MPGNRVPGAHFSVDLNGSCHCLFDEILVLISRWRARIQDTSSTPHLLPSLLSVSVAKVSRPDCDSLVSALHWALCFDLELLGRKQAVSLRWAF